MSIAISKIDLKPTGSKTVDLVKPDIIPEVKRFYSSLKATEESFFLRDQIQKHLEEMIEKEKGIDKSAATVMRRLFRGCQEIVLFSEYTYALLRPKIGVKRIVRLHPSDEKFEEVSRFHYLEIKDAYVQGPEVAAKPGLVIDFAPYFLNYPKIKEPSEMGEGISFLNRHLSGQMYQNPEMFRRALLQFLQGCHLNGTNILANDHLANTDILSDELDSMRTMLTETEADQPSREVSHELRTHGFEGGWGNTAGAISENLASLARLVESPDPVRFETLLGRLPLVRTMLMVSPHGWFAQEDVLGKPDTGGQITYVLDQTRALERQMKRKFEESGIDEQPRIIILTRLIPNAEGTTCNVQREKVHGTEDCWILRVPFRDESGEIIPDWISRFHIWPYLENFAEEARNQVVTELMGKPDLIIGHYSDGNLVAHLLAESLGTTHCAVGHALEKTKYLFSDMMWADMEHDYNFSLHFTADIISYNSADFIITSSYREIGGTNSEMGMYESYETFSMPGLYRVPSGMDPQLARYNIVPPGASEEYFYPYGEEDRRVKAVTDHLEERIFGAEPSENALGHLNNPDLPPIFAMSRMDRVKNLGGLVELFGKSETLREAANLVIVSSIIDAAQSHDMEEIEQVNRLHELIDVLQLDGHIRWAASRLDKEETGEIYRIIADRHGVFAQPALMETFGLTVIEAMSCGVPVVVTCFGGPAEIVIKGKSGDVVDPNDQEAFAQALERIVRDRDLWAARSRAGIERVEEAFNWDTHSQRVLRLANIYSYWNFLDVMNRQALDRYIHTIYHTVYRQRAYSLMNQ